MTNLPKTVAARFPDFEGENGFFREAKKYALNATPSSKEKVSFHFVCYQ